MKDRKTTPRPARKTGFLRRLTWVVCAGALVLMSGLGFGAWLYWLHPFGEMSYPRRVAIAPGEGLHKVAMRLEREGLVRSALAFEVLSVLTGDQGKIQAGEYQFAAPESAARVLKRLTEGDILLHEVTLPEGWNLWQIAGRLAQRGLVDKQRFLERAKDPHFIREVLGFEAPSLEGFLFPNTYRFQRGWGEKRILRKLVDQFHHRYDLAFRQRTIELDWSILEIVTLASLIEKEAALPDEQRLVSGVFHRRLKLGMRLESDPSVIYGLDDYEGSLRKGHLAEAHRYNTYHIKGLPPGPICNPGRDALRAALFPADQDYLYFVSRNDGSHHFSRTFDEHLRAVRKYQRGR